MRHREGKQLFQKSQSAHVVEGGNQNTDSHTAIPKEWK